MMLFTVNYRFVFVNDCKYMQGVFLCQNTFTLYICVYIFLRLILVIHILNYSKSVLVSLGILYLIFYTIFK